MAKTIHIVLSKTEASWVLAGLSEKYDLINKQTGIGADNALKMIENTISQILEELIDSGNNVMLKRNPNYRYVKQINFIPIAEN